MRATTTIKPTATKKCKYCKDRFVKNPNRPLQFVCEPPKPCSWLYVKEQKKKNEDKKWRGEKKEMKDKLQTLGQMKNLLQPLVNKIARLIDNGQPCIATGKHEGKRNGGHYLSIGSNDTIRFNLHNIHIQSEQSNSYKSGDTLNYQAGIRRIYGQDYFNRLEGLKSIPAMHLTKDRIRELLPIARRIIKELEKSGEVYPPEKRIELRDHYNRELGIYI